MPNSIAQQHKHHDSPIDIRALAIFEDNYVWLIIHRDKREAIAIDVGDALPVLECLRAENLNLRAIWITHAHHDHIGGVAALCRAYPEARVYAHHGHLAEMTLPSSTRTVAVVEGKHLNAWGASAVVWESFGHTDNHLSYVLTLDGTAHVFCGDTLFSGGCGRIFTGTYAQMYASLQRYLSLKDDSCFYPAHEYTLANLAFCAHMEPDNADTLAALETLQQARAANPKHISLPVRLLDERKTNVFLRTDVPSVVNALKEQNALSADELTANSGLAVFTALRNLKNTF